MLPAESRMRRRRDFIAAVRRGSRSGRKLLTGHLLVPAAGAAAEDCPPRAGFVVSRAVGGAVVRNRVRRRLREVARARASSLRAGSLLVIRANPRAAGACQRDLAAELDLVLGRLIRRQVRA